MKTWRGGGTKLRKKKKILFFGGLEEIIGQSIQRNAV